MSMNPRTIAARLTLVLLLLPLAAPPAGAARWKTLRPDGGKKTTLLVKEKPWNYWRLKPGEEMNFTVDVPGRYRVITRAELGTRMKKEATYTFRIGIDDPEGILYSRATIPAKTVQRKGKAKLKIGARRIVELEVPSGAETITIRLGRKARYPVYFRVQRENDIAAGRVNYVAITPESYLDALGVFVHEEGVTYYFIDKEGSLSLHVNGPTTLKVLARILMDDTMRGRIKLSVAVHEDGVLKNTYALSTSPSQIAEVPERANLRPSRGESFYVEVPKGRHRYSFTLPENNREVFLRFFLPEQDLAREAKSE